MYILNTDIYSIRICEDITLLTRVLAKDKLTCRAFGLGMKRSHTLASQSDLQARVVMLITSHFACSLPPHGRYPSIPYTDSMVDLRGEEHVVHA
jgi:hypothetical protein